MIQGMLHGLGECKNNFLFPHSQCHFSSLHINECSGGVKEGTIKDLWDLDLIIHIKYHKVHWDDKFIYPY